MPAVTRISDLSTADPCGAPPRPPIASSSNVFACGQPVVRMGDAYAPHACPSPAPPHPATASGGAGSVFVNGLSVHRAGDAISCGSFATSACVTVCAGDGGV